MANKRSNRERFPELYNAAHSQIDRRGFKREVPMQVLGLGLPRTGTSSLRVALKQLGYNDVHHMQSVWTNPEEAVLWREAADAKWFGKGKPFGRAEFDMLLGDCEAVLDYPASAFWEELIEAYPEAKVVLNTRDIASWQKSIDQTIGKANNEGRPLIQKLVWVALGYLDTPVMAKLNPFIYKLMTGSSRPYPTLNKDVFVRHYDAIRAAVPKDNLLEYNVAQGWKPLCEFLGKEIPDTPFPRVNETAEFGDRLGYAIQLAMVRVLKKGLWLSGALLSTAVGVYVYTRQN